ncbi:hypothetical protein GOP47_0004858 [Adiantum capillus-veneris]|uniref:Uncharacterized protein n=1 Tax=Adiantum capillus-veneris TaxID=13818 RepID=A0A9D4V421_ADICA|nr:hypothetical protein GOP47_0004858 [Adiantum capillus-veneris]
MVKLCKRHQTTVTSWHPMLPFSGMWKTMRRQPLWLLHHLPMARRLRLHHLYWLLRNVSGEAIWSFSFLCDGLL